MVDDLLFSPGSPVESSQIRNFVFQSAFINSDTLIKQSNNVRVHIYGVSGDACWFSSVLRGIFFRFYDFPSSTKITFLNSNRSCLLATGYQSLYGQYDKPNDSDTTFTYAFAGVFCIYTSQ